MGRRRPPPFANTIRKVVSGNQVYILKLRDECFYIGYTHDIKQRIKAHKRKKGSSWTCLHRPKKVIWHKRFKSQDEAMKVEHILTRYYAINYGQDNVRGSYWTSVSSKPPTVLKENEKEILSNLGFGSFNGSNKFDNTNHSQQVIQINSQFKYCSKCGYKTYYSAKFCSECGFIFTK